MSRCLALVVVATSLVAAGCGGSASLASGRPDPLRPPGHTTAVTRGSLTRASVEVTSGAASVKVDSADLDPRLLTATTSPTSSQRPTIQLGPDHSANVALVADATGSNGAAALNVTVDSAVRWTIDLDGGATNETVDLRDAAVDEVNFGAGVTRASVALPAQSGQITITETGGASQLTVSVPRSVASVVHVTGGASLVTIGSARHTGVAGGTVYRDPGYASAPSQLNVELTAGVSSFRLRRVGS